MKVSLSAYHADTQKAFDDIGICHFHLKARISSLFAEHKKRIGSRQMLSLLRSASFKAGHHLVRK